VGVGAQAIADLVIDRWPHSDHVESVPVLATLKRSTAGHRFLLVACEARDFLDPWGVSAPLGGGHHDDVKRLDSPDEPQREPFRESIRFETRGDQPERVSAPALGMPRTVRGPRRPFFEVTGSIRKSLPRFHLTRLPSRMLGARGRRIWRRMPLSPSRDSRRPSSPGMVCRRVSRQERKACPPCGNKKDHVACGAVHVP
jgi:hypothetical protein